MFGYPGLGIVEIDIYGFFGVRPPGKNYIYNDYSTCIVVPIKEAEEMAEALNKAITKYRKEENGSL